MAVRTWTQVTTSHYSVQHDWSREPERSTWISPDVTLVKADKVPRRGNFPNLGLILKLWFEIFILGTHSYILIAISNHHLLAYGFEPTFESSGLRTVFRIKLREKICIYILLQVKIRIEMLPLGRSQIPWSECDSPSVVLVLSPPQHLSHWGPMVV